MRSTVIYIVQRKRCWHGEPWGGDNLCTWAHATEPCRRELMPVQKDETGDYFWGIGSDEPINAKEIEILHTFQISERIDVWKVTE